MVLDSRLAAFIELVHMPLGRFIPRRPLSKAYWKWGPVRGQVFGPVFTRMGV